MIGSGFGGLFGTKALKRADVDVTMIAKTTHHLFQPLLYQVATGILSQGEIAPPTREILAEPAERPGDPRRGHRHRPREPARHVPGRSDRVTVTPYDSLIVAAGAGQSYFGNDHFAEYAPGMKSIDDALELRGRIFGAFELAELAETEEEIERLLTFVVVGAGPTGVEMAGQIAELAHRTLRKDFRRINTREARIILLDAAPQVLPPFGAKLGPATQAVAGEARRRGAARRDGHRRRRAGHRSSQTKDGQRRPDRGGHQGLGRRRPGQPARQDARRAERRPARPRRPDRGEPRPDAARPPRGLRGRRHDRARQPPGCRAGGDPGREVRRQGDRPSAQTGSRRRSRSSTSTRAAWPRSRGSARSR